MNTLFGDEPGIITDKHAVHYSSATPVWSTPMSFFKPLQRQYGFTLDVCALPENAKCVRFFSPGDNGLVQDWAGEVCWCNPPYGKTCGHWVAKAYHESRKAGTVVVALLPARTDVKWFHDYIYNKEGVVLTFVRGRLKFGGATDPAPFPSMLVEFNLTPTPEP